MTDDLRSLLPKLRKPPETSGDDSPAEELDAPHARPSNRAEFAFHIIRRGDWVAFQYAHLDSHADLQGNQQITLRFAGTKTWQVTLTGSNLLPLYRLIHQHRLAWVRETDALRAAALPAGSSVVEKVEITEAEGDDE
jgi:hypothetical protein